MAITINKLNKPWLWFEAVAGGSLAASTTFYFIGFNAYINGSVGPYYGYAPGPSSDEFSCTTTVTNKKIKMEVYESGGYVTAYADTGDAVHVTVTSTAHGLANGDTVYLRGTTNYTGKYTVSGATANTFDIVATWVADDGASNWYKTPGMPDNPTGSPGKVTFYIKWDYYSMLRGDGSKFQWLNTNNPTYSNEWYTSNSIYDTYGHRRWGGAFYYNGFIETNLTTAGDGSKYYYYDTVTTDASAHYWNTSALFEGTSSGSVNGFMAHPEIAMRKYSDASGTVQCKQLPAGMTEDCSAIMVLIDNTNYNNGWRYFITALRNADVLGKSVIINFDDKIAGNSNDDYIDSMVTMRGMIFQKSAAFTTQPVWYNKTLTLIHGIVYCAYSTNKLLFNGCSLLNLELSSMWYQPSYSATNTRNDVACSASFILDSLGVMTNYTPYTYRTNMTAYSSKDGFTFLGRANITTNSVQMIRYPVDGAYARNMKAIREVFYAVPTSAGPRTYEYTNVEFSQIQSDATNISSYNMDFILENLATLTGLTVYHTWNCYNVTSSERSNGLCRVSFTLNTIVWNTDSQLLFNFYFSLNATVVDPDGVAINGASLSIVNNASTPDTYSATTDSNGVITAQNIKCYKVEYDDSNTDGYSRNASPSTAKFYSKTTVFNDITITVTKTGYETQTIKVNDMLASKSLSITMKAIKPIRLLTDGAVSALTPETGSDSLLVEL